MTKILNTLLILCCCAQANTWIRIGYVYPSDTRDRYGSDTAAAADIAAKHSFVQTAFKRSGTQTRISALRLARVNSNMTTATDTLSQMYDFIDNIRTTFVWPYQFAQSRVRWDWGKRGANYASRNELSLMCFVSPLESGICYGQAYGPCSLVKYNSPAGIYTHEIGHNFTLAHGTGGYVKNDEDADLSESEFYASNLSNNKRTGMAGASEAYSIARYSNPNRTYSGYPYGTADRNNASIIRTTRTSVRAYKDAW